MSRAWIFVVVAASVGCIKAPEIVMVDRATALEQQAGGSFPEIEKKLARASVSSRPVPLTPDQLESLGMTPAPIADEHETTDADRVDDLLERHCIGEGNEGLLAETSDACRGAVDREEVTKLVDRVNRSRTQLWRWMHDQKPDAPLEDLRKRWRATHAAGVTCGAWVQGDDGKWGAKPC
jgi:hypothetical protein